MREHIHDPLTEVFVFGSNLDGDYCGGAAKYAKEKCGAINWIGQGFQQKPFLFGQNEGAYALPTCAKPGVALTLDQVAIYVAAFLIYANLNPDKTFFVTRVGCGIAGFTDDQIAPLFAKAPLNCYLPPEWDKFADQLIAAIESER